METLKSLSSKALNTVKSNLSSLATPITAIVVGYMALLILLILSYYLAWLHNALHGTIVLNDLYILIHELSGASMLAVVTFISGCFVDLDKDGVPDNLEKKEGR